MKKLILSLIVGVTAFVSTGQIAVTGIAPASIVGNYNFTYGDTDEGWIPALDFSIPGTYVEGELVIVEDGASGTNPQGIPVSQEGCGVLTNAAAVNGKIAVVYRNTCEFGRKAKRAQDAGAIAVIILNRDPEVIGIGAGTDGSTVTIPVVMLSSIDGAILTNEMENGPVTMFIGNKAGLHDNDLAFNDRLILTPKYNGVHSLLAQNGTDFNFDLGLRVYNYGSETQTNANANVTITAPGGATIYDEDVAFSLDGVSGLIIDSVDIFPGEALNFPQFSQSTYPNGEYTVTYTLTNGGGVADDFPSDNTYSIKFVINNTYISRARLNPTTFKPIAESQVSAADPAAPAAPYSELRYCMSFSDANASRLAATGLHTVVSVDTAVSESLLNSNIFVEVFQWNNPVDVINNTGGYDNLVSVASGNHDFVNDVTSEEVFFTFSQPVMFLDNQPYLFCVIDYGQKLRVGFDRSVDFNATIQHYNLLTNPLYAAPNPNPTPWFGGGFGPDLTPAFGIRAIAAESVSVDALTKLEGKAFPNPTKDVIRMNIPMDGKATVSVTDLSGRTVANHNVSFLNNQATINVADLNTGMYIINVAYDNGSKSTFNVVKN
jgi:hypothetical protein